MPRTLLHKQEKGHLGQYEDWWYLVEKDDGSKHIEHEWDHVAVRGFDKREGSEIIAIEKFLESGPDKAVTKLKELLA